MSDLSSLNISEELLPLAQQIMCMRRGGSKERQKPHKILMLLAVLDLFDQGLLKDNQIYFNSQLIGNYEKYFRLYAEEGDWCQPGPPFFHLRGAYFWKHNVKKNREHVYARIKSSGGETKRITENIEYAYFDEETFSILSKKNLRSNFRRFLISLLRQPNTMIIERLPTAFHETFVLSRPSIKQVIHALTVTTQSDNLQSKVQRDSYLREHTQLGTNYVKAMPEYAKGAGLVDFSYRLTSFGKYVIEKDPDLEQLSTQWLMHYYLSAMQGPGPSFWHEIIMSDFRSGDEFTQKEIAEKIGIIFKREKGKTLSYGTTTSTANAFLGTYVKSDALGKLGFLEEIGDNHYLVRETDSPPTWPVAVGLVEYWKAFFPQQVTINMSSLTTESGLANIFMVSRSRLQMILEEMREAGVVELFRVAPPYQVALLNDNLEILFSRMYSYEQPM